MSGKIVILTTGGTIAMRRNPDKAGAVPAVNGAELVAAVPGLANLHCRQVEVRQRFLRVERDGATVCGERAGQVVPRGERDSQVDERQGLHRIEISAAGRTPTTREIRLQEAQVLELTLEPGPPPVGAGVAPTS